MPIPTFPLTFTINRELPVEDVTWNGSRVVVPWTFKLTVDEVAFTPMTVPLLSKDEAEVMLEPEVK